MNTILDHIHLWTTAQTPKTSGRGNRADNQQLLGIQKLRELILELAVRGKLVPQDPNDEPASVLLKKIEAEKKRLVKEGRIKKQEVLPEVGEDEKSFDLPKSWEWTRLGNISQINPRNDKEDDTIVSFVPMNLITTNYNGSHGNEERVWKEIKQGFTHFANGDIGIAKITPCFENSKAVIFSNLLNGIGAGTTELHIARPFGETLVNRYILLYLKAPQFLLIGETKMTGTAGQKRVPKSFFSGNPFPLPPLAEQHRIVAKVDELMALCDQLEQQQTENNQLHQTLVETLLANLTQASNPTELEDAWQRISAHFDTLFATEYSIDQLKQTILQLAVMGNLVPQNPEDEPAGELLKKIAKEKARLVKEGKIKKQTPLPEITDDEKPFELPQGWEWARLQKIVSLLGDGLHGTPAYTPNTKYYFVNGNNLKNGKIEIKPDTKTVSEEEMLKYKKDLTNNSILVSINGTLGNVAFYDGEDIMLGKSACYFNLLDNISKLHIKLVLESPYFIDYAFKNATGTTIKNLGLKAMNEFVIPLPPLAEQHRIVAKVDELFALCDALKERLAQAQTTQNLLAETVVAQALL